MPHFQDKIPIHRCPVDIFKLNSWTWGAINPADMSTDKALDILWSRQFFHEGYFTPDADNPLNRLRVFRIANTVRLGRGAGQERWLRMGPSENYVAR
jgi:hypothetical protein